MSHNISFVYIIEILGTIAFASSGALLAMEKHMDIFGVCILGITTSVGGGIIRDIVLGNTPPNVFQNSSYVLVAIVVSTILFIYKYVKNHTDFGLFDRVKNCYDITMLWMDAIGLGIFTVVGINTAVIQGYKDNLFLLVFVGMVTGSGGGMLRDIMALRIPFVFVKHVYASASLAGALVYIALMDHIIVSINMTISATVVVAIRVAAAHYKWNLPSV